MDYFPNIKPKRKDKSSLKYLGDSDVILDSEGSEIRGETHRTLRSTMNGHRRPLSAESSNSSSVDFRRSEVGFLYTRRLKNTETKFFFISTKSSNTLYKKIRL